MKAWLFRFIVLFLGVGHRDSVYLHALNSLLLFYRKQLPGGNIFVSWFPWPLRVNKVSPFFNLLRTQRVWAYSRQLILIFPRTSRIPLSQDTLGMNACGRLLGTFLWLLPSSRLDNREGSPAIAPYNFAFKVMNHYHHYVLFFLFFFFKGVYLLFQFFLLLLLFFPFYSELILSHRSIILMAHFFVYPKIQI